jgi:hypothetical protein
MYLPVEKAEMVLRLLLEGNSVSSVERLAEVHHTTILKLLVLAGAKCERLRGKLFVNVPVRDVQADDIRQFIGCKEKRRRPEHDANWGCYTFVAMETHTKLALNVAIGRRDQATTDGGAHDEAPRCYVKQPRPPVVPESANARRRPPSLSSIL